MRSMKLSIFDEYNLRARISVWIIFISPIILPAYLMIDTIRAFSTTAIVVLILIALSNLYIIHIRNCAKHGKSSVDKRSIVKEYFVNDSKLSRKMRNTICDKMQNYGIDQTEIQILKNKETADPKYSDILDNVINIIKESQRKNTLVREENIQYGFCRNLYAIRLPGTIITGSMIILEVICMKSACIDVDTDMLILSLAVDALFLLIWLFGINRKLVIIAAENYAECLFNAFEGKL